MIEDIEGRIIEVGRGYGLDAFESLYVFDSLVHMGYDAMGYGLCSFMCKGIKVGNSLVNFISYVDSNLFSLDLYLRMLRSSYGVYKRGSGSYCIRRSRISRSISYLRVYRQLRRFRRVGISYGDMGYYSVSSSDRSRSSIRLRILRGSGVL